MKFIINRKVLFFVIYLIINISVFSEDSDKKLYVENYFTYSALGIIQINPFNYDPGFTFGVESLIDFSGSEHSHLIGIDYRNTYWHNSIQWYYCFLPDIGFNDFIFFPIWTSINSFPFGMNMIYNFETNLFSVGPKISYYYNISFSFFSFDYTYNITINDYNKSFHQFAIKAGITFDIFF